MNGTSQARAQASAALAEARASQAEAWAELKSLTARYAVVASVAEAEAEAARVRARKLRADAVAMRAALVTEAKIAATAAGLRSRVAEASVWESRPILRKMADAVEAQDWASLRTLAERLDGYEAWAGVRAGIGLRKVAENAIAFTRTVSVNAAQP